MKKLTALFITLALTACGETDDKRTYTIQGEQLRCTVIDQTPCGLTLACDDRGIFECVTN